jgi:carboxylesterase
MNLPQSLVVPHGCPPGAEPRARVQGREGVLILHGFTGSPWEMAPVCDALEARGYTVAMPVLAGHATAVQALGETTWQDWLQSAEDALVWLDGHCDVVHHVGLSMGALLTLLMARQRPQERLGRIALLAPAICMPPWQRVVILAFARLGWPTVLGKEDPILANGQKPPGYQAIPLRAAASFVALQDLAVAEARPLPALVLHGTLDLTIPCEPACARIPQLLGAQARVERIAGAGHLLLRTDAGPQVIQRVVSWLEG